MSGAAQRRRMSHATILVVQSNSLPFLSSVVILFVFIHYLGF